MHFLFDLNGLFAHFTHGTQYRVEELDLRPDCFVHFIQRLYKSITFLSRVPAEMNKTIVNMAVSDLQKPLVPVA